MVVISILFMSVFFSITPCFGSDVGENVFPRIVRNDELRSKDIVLRECFRKFPQLDILFSIGSRLYQKAKEQLYEPQKREEGGILRICSSGIIPCIKDQYPQLILVPLAVAFVYIQYCKKKKQGMNVYTQSQQYTHKKKQSTKPSRNRGENLQLKQYIQKLFGLDAEIDDTCLSKLNSELLRTLLEHDGKSDWYTQLLYTIHPAGIENVFNKSKELAAFCALELKPGVLVSHTELYKILFLCAGLTKDPQTLELLCAHYADQSNAIRYGYNQQYTLPALLTILVPECTQKTECLKLLERYKFDTNSNLLQTFAFGMPEFIGNSHTIEGPQAEITFMVNGRSTNHYHPVLQKNLRKIWYFLASEYPLSVHCHGNFTVEIWTGDFLDSLNPKNDRYFLNPNRSEILSTREDECYCYLNEEIDKNKFTGMKNPSYEYIWRILYDNQNKYYIKSLTTIFNHAPSNLLDFEWEKTSIKQKEGTKEIHATCKKILSILEQQYDPEQLVYIDSELERYQGSVEQNDDLQTYEVLSFDPPEFMRTQSAITSNEYVAYVKQLIKNRLTSLEALEIALSNLIRSTHLDPEDTTALIRLLLSQGTKPDCNHIIDVFKTLRAALDRITLHDPDNNTQSELISFINSRYHIAQLLLHYGAPLPLAETYETIVEAMHTRIRTHLENKKRNTKIDPFYKEERTCLTNILNLITDEQRLRQRFAQLSGQDSNIQKKIFDLLLATIDTLYERSERPGLWVQHVTQFSEEGWKLLFETINTLCSATAWNGYQCTTMRRALSLLLALTTHKPISEQYIPLVQNCVKRIIEEGDRKQVYEYDQYQSMHPVLTRCIERTNKFQVPSVFKKYGTNIVHLLAQSGFDNQILSSFIGSTQKHHRMQLLWMLLQKQKSPAQFLCNKCTPFDLALANRIDEEQHAPNKKVCEAFGLMKTGLQTCIDFYNTIATKSHHILPKQFEEQIYEAKQILRPFLDNSPQISKEI